MPSLILLRRTKTCWRLEVISCGRRRKVREWHCKAGSRWRASFNHWPLAIWAQRLPRKGAKSMQLRRHFLSVLAPAQVHAPPPPLLQPLPPQHTQSHQKSLSEILGLRQWSPSDSSLPSFHKRSHPHPGATTKTTGRRLLFITLTVSPHRHTHMWPPPPLTVLRVISFKYWVLGVVNRL